MSIAKTQLEAQQPPTQIITQAPSTLDFASAFTVNREQLSEAYSKARFASRRLNTIEAVRELDMEAVDDLCRSLYRATQLLGEMLNAKGEVAR